MLFKFTMLLTVLSLVPLLLSAKEETDTETVVVQLMTNLGPIKFELWPREAPKTVDNFVEYVRSGHYNGTVFHRVISGFMVQGGGFSADMTQKETKDSIVNEATNGLLNERGTIAMARTTDVDSATSQFFINLADNTFLNHRNTTPSGYGYCVFGRVAVGMDIVDKMAKAKTASKGYHQDVPVDSIVIETVEVL